MPWPVRSSVLRPMMNPIMARRPFQVSAKEEKPNLVSIALLRNVTTIQVCWCAARIRCGICRRSADSSSDQLSAQTERSSQYPGTEDHDKQDVEGPNRQRTLRRVHPLIKDPKVLVDETQSSRWSLTLSFVTQSTSKPTSDGLGLKGNER